MTGMRRQKAQRNDQGYTLIEVLVVIVIISIIASFAVLKFDFGNQSRQTEMEAKHLLQVLRFAQQQAMLKPAIIGFRGENNTYEFMYYNNTDEAKPGEWQSVEHDNLLSYTVISAKTHLKIMTPVSETNLAQAMPAIVFYPSGEMSAFTIAISAKDKSAVFNLVGYENGDIVLKKANE